MLLPETLKLHDQSRFEFHYIYFLPWKDQMVPSLQEAGGRVACFSASNNIKLLMKYKEVVNYCEEKEIDLIHCHLPWSGFLGRLVYSKTKIPVIYTEHNIQERYHIATKSLNRLTFNSQSIALGVSNDVTRSINENISPAIPVKTLLNGVNTQRFKKDPVKGIGIKEKYDIPGDAAVIGNIAVFRGQKGIPDWIKAFNKIIEGRENIYGILVGAGPLENEIEQQIRELGLTEKIKLAGLQTDTVSYFSAMDIFMMSSQFEGLPIALLEAMSMECAVVSTKAGGVVEVVREGEDGFLCEVGEWSCLAEKVSFLLDNEFQMKDLQMAARQRVASAFSLKSMVDKLEDLYESTLETSLNKEEIN